MGRFSSRRFDSGRLHYSRGIGQGEDDEDDVLRERGPGLAKTCEPRVNRRQVLPIGVRVARLRRCQAALRKSQTLAKKATCGTRVSGAIPAARSAPAWRAGSLAVLDRRAAELRRFPSLWRSARRSHRPVRRTAGGTESSRSFQRRLLTVGSPATRAAMIETLLERGYITREKKTLLATDLGRYLVALDSPGCSWLDTSSH